MIILWCGSGRFGADFSFETAPHCKKNRTVERQYTFFCARGMASQGVKPLIPVYLKYVYTAYFLIFRMIRTCNMLYDTYAMMRTDATYDRPSASPTPCRCDRCTSAFPLWVLGAAVVGVCRPAALVWFHSGLITAALATTMVSDRPRIISACYLTMSRDTRPLRARADSLQRIRIVALLCAVVCCRTCALSLRCLSLCAPAAQQLCTRSIACCLHNVTSAGSHSGRRPYTLMLSYTRYY